jgi:hypothetical protein
MKQSIGGTMLVHPLHTNLTLIEPNDLHIAHQGDQPPIVRNNYQTFTLIFNWAEIFLCQPHPQLGREGAVCPYTRTSLNKHYFHLAIHQEQEVSLATAKQQLLLYRNWFLTLEPIQPKSDAQYKAILLLFPQLANDHASQIIDTLQRELKPSFVEAGLMIGQFHAQCNEPGLWNEHFYPLRAPLPLLAIRHMVPTDFPFLRHNSAFLASYLRICGKQIPPKWQAIVKQQQKLLALPIED